MKQRFAAYVQDLTPEIPEDPIPELERKLKKARREWDRSKGNPDSKSYKTACSEIADLFVLKFDVERLFSDTALRFSASLSSSLDEDHLFDIEESDDNEHDIEDIFEDHDELIFHKIRCDKLTFVDDLSPNATLICEFELNLKKKFGSEKSFLKWQSNNVDFDDIADFVPNEEIFAGYDEDGDIDTSYSYESGETGVLVQRPKETKSDFSNRVYEIASQEDFDDEETEWTELELAIRTGNLARTKVLVKTNSPHQDSTALSPLALAISGAVLAERLFPSILDENQGVDELHSNWKSYQKAARKIITVLLENGFGPDSVPSELLYVLKSAEGKIAASILHELRDYID